MKKNKKRGITVGEKLLYSLAGIALVLTFALKVFCGASISELQIKIANINSEIETQQNKNESLTMQVNELTSYENLATVLSEMGLAYNNENIIVVNK